MFDRREFLRALGVATFAAYACKDGVDPGIDPPPDGDPLHLSVSPEDPHYLQGSEGHPLFLLGFGDPLGWYHPTLYEDLKSAYVEHELSFARILLPWAGPASSLVAYTHERTGPGTALDGGLKFDLARIDEAFLDRLEDMISWANENRIVVAVGLWHDSPFEEDVLGDYTWSGSVVNPANRINPQCADMLPAAVTLPWFYDILGLNPGCVGGGCWDSGIEREWLRDRVKELFDAVLLRLQPYGNCYIELGSRAYFKRDAKRYWANYVRGYAHTLDDGAVSPYALPSILLIDQPYEPWVGTTPPFTGYPNTVQQHTIPELAGTGPGAVNAAFTELTPNGFILYEQNKELMGTPEGSHTSDNRNNRRRAAWQALLAGAHYDSYLGVVISPWGGYWGQTPSSFDFLADYEALMSFVRANRNGSTIEQQLVYMQPGNSRIVSARDVSNGPFCLEYKPGKTEHYLVFANAGANPTVSVDSAGLVITRYDTITAAQDTDPGGPTVAGSNVLTSTGNDTAWWIG